MNIQAKMISDLAKKIKSEPKSRDQVLEFLKSAKILAENGDIVFIAENGNIKLKARNIYIETTGADPAGNFLVSSNGYITLAAGEQTRIAGSKVCIRGDGGVDIGSASYIMFRGAFKYGDYPSITGTIKALLAGNWAKLLDGIDQSCK
jgi:hypothetical protein